MPLDKIIDRNIAAKAYTNTQGFGQKSPGIDLDQGDDVSFAQFLKGKLQDSVQTMKSSEQMSGKAVAGEAELTDVVQAVTSAEIALQTVVSIRDRLISAYQDVMRMPI